MSLTETRTVSSIQAKAAIDRCFKIKRPVFLWGPPGIGKSELIAAIANSGTFGNSYMIDLRMPLLEPTDLRGIPYYDKPDNTMKWAPPVDLPTEQMAAEYDTIILFLDEMNAAAPAVQASGYQLILNRRVGNYKLPDNVVIVAAGNRESDKGVTYRMPSPLANRFVHLEMTAEFDSWFMWAVENNIHPDVVGYLQFAKQDLFDFDPRSSSRAFATPRAWTFVSELIEDVLLDEQTMLDLVAGTVGEGLALKFMAHRKIAGSLPNPSDILTGEVTKMENKEISAMYSLTVSMCYELQEAYKKEGDKKKWHDMADNFFKFMMDNFETELVVMGARVALVNYKLPFQPGKLKSFNEFHKRFGKYVINANND